MPAQHLTLCTGNSLKNEEVKQLEVGQTVTPAGERAQLGCSHGPGTALVPVLPRHGRTWHHASCPGRTTHGAAGAQ